MTAPHDATASEGWQQIAAELRAFVRRRVHDAHAAEDLVQEVLAKLAQEASTRGAPGQLAPWVFRVAQNAVIDHYRTRKPVAALPELADPNLVDPAEDELRRLGASFRRFVHALPPQYREAVLLTEYEGLNQRELAERLGVPVPTAKSRLQRGRAQLRKALLACCTFEVDRRGRVVDWRRHGPDACPECS